MLACVHGRRMNPTTAPLVAAALASMERRGLSVMLEEGLSAWLKEHGHKRNDREFSISGTLPVNAELFITLGGDGTFLDGVAMVGPSGVPMLGVNLGRLGYLSTVRFEELDAVLATVVKGDLVIEERALVQVDGCGDLLGNRNYALNEISVHKRDNSTMLAVHSSIGDHYLNTYWADGLIVATPTGSTAYSLSCGGPLLDPDCEALLLTPIAPHNLNVRPFVVPDHHEIRLTVDPRGDLYLVNLDSRNVTMGESTELRIRKAPFKLRMMQVKGHDHLDTLREKLGWGHDIRSGSSPSGTRT